MLLWALNHNIFPRPLVVLVVLVRQLDLFLLKKFDVQKLM